ncbi:DUF4245 domain-containing protein [Nocardioides panacisoli]|uniref:DUF4245 family protein n=1 Tax=Nocardioides panacisoli TaxID=627624 RepID=UPI001C6389CC|nr:DUF4245 family protein [Nocardioides panacisoli]QYJ02601.1 DUF4245 domain-containing protein [Nocardioides panacisoli]
MSEQNGKPGRYQRSASGLVASLLVIGVLVLLVVWLMGLFRSAPEVEPTPIDYTEAIGAAQDAGQRPVYPSSLPGGWIATGFEVDPGTANSYGLKLLTAEDDFVGISQADESAGTLLRRHVDEDEQDISDAPGYDATRSVASEWAGYTDLGGDTAYAAEVGDTTVLVYGSASPEELQIVIESLTREQLRD